MVGAAPPARTHSMSRVRGPQESVEQVEPQFSQQTSGVIEAAAHYLGGLDAAVSMMFNTMGRPAARDATTSRLRELFPNQFQ